MTARKTGRTFAVALTPLGVGAFALPLTVQRTDLDFDVHEGMTLSHVAANACAGCGFHTWPSANHIDWQFSGVPIS